MLLYHGTSERFARRAMREGLLPRGSRSGNWRHSVNSRADAVYLTTAYALYFALNATDDPRLKSGQDGVRAAIVEVDTDRLDTGLMMPDEDFMEQATRKGEFAFPTPPQDWTMAKRTRWYRRRLDAFGTLWGKSVEHLGNAAYRGPILPAAITRVAFIDLRLQADLCFAAMDPTIGLLNYRFVGGRYRDMTRWIFGEPMMREGSEIAGMWFHAPAHRDGIEIVDVNPAERRDVA